MKKIKKGPVQPRCTDNLSTCGNHCLIGPVTLGSDYRTILKSDPILLIFISELDVPILKIDKFAVTLLRFIRADFIAKKVRQ